HTLLLVSLSALSVMVAMSAPAETAREAPPPSIKRDAYGKLPDGTPVELFTLANGKGMVAKITNYGALLTELRVGDRDGILADVVLGCDDLKSYVAGHPFFGCTVGRVANRIAKGRITLDGKEYKLATNNGPNHLHGGIKGFDKVVW